MFLEEPTYSMIADDNISTEYFHKKLRMLIVTPSAAHYYHFRLRDNATLLALICDKMYSLCLVLCIYPCKTPNLSFSLHLWPCQAIGCSKFEGSKTDTYF